MVSTVNVFLWNARARNTHVEATLNHPFPAQTPPATSSAIDRRGARGTAEPFCETVAETSMIDSDRVPSRRFQYARPPAAATTREKAILPMGITRASFFVRTGFAFFVARLPTDAMVLSRVLNQAWPPVAVGRRGDPDTGAL